MCTVQPEINSAQPVRMPGLVAAWPAVTRWSGAQGVQNLSQLAGHETVQVMLSHGQFVGDMQHLMLLNCKLDDFIRGTLLQEIESSQPAGLRDSAASTLHAYLAQCPISAARVPGGKLHPGPLHALAADAPPPTVLDSVLLSQINFWASFTPTRSSCHYDPYTNLLCVAAGCKVVRLLPPQATGMLYAQPVFHESANHSPVDLAAPDLRVFPALAAALPALQTHTLKAGDALLIPEGWWHQVDSTAHTLAVNFWWLSQVATALGKPADTFYLRSLAQSLLEEEKRRVIASLQTRDLGLLLQAPGVTHQLAELAADDASWNESDGYLLSLPADTELHSARKALPAVHALGRRLVGSELAALGALLAGVEAHRQRQLVHPDDTISPELDAILASLVVDGSDSLLRVLLVLRKRRPAAATHLLLHVLSPVAWELVVAAGEAHEADATAAGMDRPHELVQLFFDELYSAVEDRQELLGVILRRKEALARMCLETVLRQALSVPQLALPEL